MPATLPITAEYLETCFRNLQAEVQLEVKRIAIKKESGQALTSDELEYMDEGGNIVDEMVLVDRFKDETDKETFVGSLDRPKKLAWKRLLAHAEAPSTTTPASPISSHPTTTTTPSASNTVPAKNDSLPASPIPTVQHDPPTAHQPSISKPLTEPISLKMLSASTGGFKPGCPYAHVGPSHLSVTKIPNLMLKLGIQHRVSDYKVHYLALQSLDDCVCCFELSKSCTFLVNSVTVNDSKDPTSIYVGPCQRCACAHRPCSTEGSYTWDATQSGDHAKRPRSVDGDDPGQEHEQDHEGAKRPRSATGAKS